MKQSVYSVRVTFKHGNGITLDCKGCGSIYIKPGHDYFFENAPMQFINYLPQLRRLGVTYRITNDKRGCYQTFNLINYSKNDPFKSLSKVRSNFASDYQKTEVEEVSTEPEESTTNITNPETVQEPMTLDTVTEQKDEEVTNSESTTVTMDDHVKADPQPTEETTESDDTISEVTEPQSEPAKDITTMSKPDLIAYAQELGLTQVTDYWTKKEIREAITTALQ